eukprot:gnl/Spiro4/23407_TR11578_c0_g1_i1.p1 gnl/Spiro4/23407_TR11578_c0_g1~~gnl/Spiro4/23407_TR11578_c0_g1_i1.p1  ORF type:complete len:359 (+),score=71.77 gnl/Spiro4/23407_TR11578_c0_g1_i1:46-1077(+)
MADARSAAAALRRWELENNVQEISADDAVYRLDLDEHVRQREAFAALNRQGRAPPKFFTKVRMSALALLKMVIHARSGGSLEVMGLMQGKLDGDTMVVMDSFALPVEGTETRVSAQMDAYEYMFQYLGWQKQVGRSEQTIGWYHSHPGYGCWLSGIDVGTQTTNQQYQDPFLAVVVDPVRTISSGKVEIGAFRTYPENYTPPASEFGLAAQNIPLAKIKDFGLHGNRYYQLEISYFKSSLDSGLLNRLWYTYWVNTLSSSPLVTNREYNAEQIDDLASKLDIAEGQLGRSVPNFTSDQRQPESQLQKLSRDCSRMTIEQVQGMMSEVVKDLVFNPKFGAAPSS